MLFRRKRTGQTLSKGRFLGAQMSAFLDGDHWLDLARRANRTAARLAQGLESVPRRAAAVAHPSQRGLPYRAEGRRRGPASGGRAVLPLDDPLFGG